MLGILPIDTSFLAWYRVSEIHERRLGFGLGFGFGLSSSNMGLGLGLGLYYPPQIDVGIFCGWV